ncbi:hypothetical protein ILUMI_18444 [Ignelater luminosus]|uniref:CWH43-like N-terminal domain-containing protein n=1 Tax=Ignelater luminosus TaxID=2038154 RepID=A0A8K0G6E1_IGNLU|nr:hypothetical protein ILUMI_18444 [Ignelater luminosus]
MYIRYRQVNAAIHYKTIDLSKTWNEIAFWIGNITCVGISIVANFQVTSILLVHMIGGATTFGAGSIYFAIQTRISASFRSIHHKYPEYGVSKSMLYLRIFLSVLFFLFFIISVSFFGKAINEFRGTDVLSWKEEDGGMEYRRLAAAFEWLMVFVFAVLASTAEKDLKSIQFEEIRFSNKLPVPTNNVKKEK